MILTSKISQTFNWFKDHANQQAGLILLASLPCLTVTIFALFWAGVSGYLIAFIFILLSLVVGYAAFAGKYKADYQLQTLSNLIEAMIDGDYSLRGRRQSNPAFQDLLGLVNRLADSLHQHKIKAEESQLLLEKLIDQMDALFIAVNAQGQVAMLNSSARKLLCPTNEELAAQSLDSLKLSPLSALSESGIIELNTTKLNGEYFIFKDQFISNNAHHDLYLLTQADRLLREKERQAWQNLLRVVSHEMNNSLTPIATFSRTMLKQLNQKGDSINLDEFKHGLAIIQERAESLHQFIASYSQLSHLPQANKQAFHWRQALCKNASFYSDCKIINLLFENNHIDKIEADPHQMEQVFINILKNAHEAMDGAAQKAIELDAKSDAHWLHIFIRDFGPGIQNSDNLFIPLYTTKPDGNGIGLSLSLQILLNHGGHLKLRNRPQIGAEAIISLPIRNNISGATE